MYSISVSYIEPNPNEKKSKKKKHKGKKSDKYKRTRKYSVAKKIQTKLAEEVRQQYIKQKQEYLKETKKRVLSEWERNDAKLQVYQKEFDSRKERLKYSYDRLSTLEKLWKELEIRERKQHEWLQYLNGNRSTSVPELNSYIFLSTEVETNNQMSFCMKKVDEILKLLDQMQDVLDYAEPEQSERFLKDLKQLRNEVRKLLQEIIDRATFNLFSRIETDMIQINVSNSKYFAKSPHFKMNLWAELITPVPSAPGHILKVNFEECDLVVLFPSTLINIPKVMRAMWLNYDHWSDNCRSYQCPPVPPYYKQNLYELVQSQYNTKADILSYREKLCNSMKKKISELPTDPVLSQEILIWDSEPQRPLSEEVIYQECTMEDDLGKLIKDSMNEYEVNLRERLILGDLLTLEVLHQPPQPKYLRFKHNVTLREAPPKLYPVEFRVRFTSGLQSPSAKKLDETEEKKKGEFIRSFGGKGDEDPRKLVAVNVKLCPTVIWFETPLVAVWDSVHSYWSTEHVHDVFYDDEEELMTFKTGSLGLMGFHVYRYCNFPYLAWSLRPEDGGVLFSLKTPKADFVFNIKEGQVCVKSMENIQSNVMNWVIGNYYPPHELLKILAKGGIYISPEADASFYINNIQAKHFVIESNIYQVFGLFSDSFGFKQSKFNQSAGRETIVFQAQEINKNHQIDFCLISAKMCSCYILEINENEEHFSPERASSQSVYVDLYSLIHKNCTEKAKRLSDSINYVMVKTVKEFLELVRPLSFS